MTAVPLGVVARALLIQELRLHETGDDEHDEHCENFDFTMSGRVGQVE